MYRATYGRVKGAGKEPCDLDHQTASQSRSKVACRPNAPKSPQNWGALGIRGYWERDLRSKLIGSAHRRQHLRSQHSPHGGAHAVDTLGGDPWRSRPVEASVQPTMRTSPSPTRTRCRSSAASPVLPLLRPCRSTGPPEYLSRSDHNGAVEGAEHGVVGPHLARLR